MSSITLDNVINVTNTLCQVIVAVAAIVAIIITFKQIQSKKKSNLRVSYSFGLSLMAKEDGTREIFEGLNIKIRNVGIAPAYYDDCGIMFVKNKKIYQVRSILVYVLHNWMKNTKGLLNQAIQ